MQKLAQALTNLPMKVVFAGFESDTRTLQSQGWELSLNQRLEFNELTLALRFKSSECIFYAEARIDRDFIYSILSVDYRDSIKAYMNVVFYIKYFTTGNIHLHISHLNMPTFKALDAEYPEFIDTREVNLRDILYFRTFDKSKELIVDPNDVNTMMDIIMKTQKPTQQKIIKKQIMDDLISLDQLDRKKIHLQLVS